MTPFFVIAGPHNKPKDIFFRAEFWGDNQKAFREFLKAWGGK